jgi:acyl-phosphate glycerol 3-phosphate acyltransferase
VSKNILIVLVQFISGSIMYSYIIAKLLNIDLSKIRDGNPGSSNLWRGAGWKYGILALLLDYSKGVFPLIFFRDINPYVLSFAALAGIAGHAFSPMLKFKGGKAIATTFGAWSVLTKWEAPTLLGTIFTIFSLIKHKTDRYEDALRYFIGLFALLIYVIYRVLYQKQYHLIILYVGNLIIAIYKHRVEIIKLLPKINT